MALSHADKLLKAKQVVDLYADGMTEQEILKRMGLTRAGFNSLFMEAQKAGLVQLDPNRPEAFQITSRALLAGIKKILEAGDDSLVKLEKLDEKSILLVLCD